MDRSRATTPALAEAAARSEEERLRHELAAKQSDLDAARAARAEPATVAGAAAAKPFPKVASVCAVLVAAAGGFWLGYATLARRIKQKFGGIKVY